MKTWRSAQILHRHRTNKILQNLCTFRVLSLTVSWLRSRVSPSTNLKLISREIIFEVFQPMWSQYLNVTGGQTDGQTDGITALCIESRGKKTNSGPIGNRKLNVQIVHTPQHEKSLLNNYVQHLSPWPELSSMCIAYRKRSEWKNCLIPSTLTSL